MTHGRRTKPITNSRSKKADSLLTGFLDRDENSLDSRVTKLEARVAQMQEEIDRLTGTIPVHFQEVIDGIGKKQHGPQKRMDDMELLLNRDNLVQWLEEHWPTIVKPLLATKNPREVSALLRTIAIAREIRPEWQKRIVGHPGKLLEFLRSNKFRRKPPKKTVMDALALYRSDRRQQAANRLPTRQIANAMAGVPKLKWRTSLDRCAKNPSSYRVGYNTANYYGTLFDISK
jgi:hypothetical protein